MLFTHTCTECARTQLIFGSQANGVIETDRGPALLFTCWCGAEQSQILGAGTGVAPRRVERTLVSA